MESLFLNKRFCRKLMLGAAGVFFVMLCQGVWAQGNAAPDDPLLAKNEWAEVRKSDYDTALMRLSEDARKRSANDPKMIIRILARLLRDKTLAAQARTEKLDQDSKAKAFLAAEIDRFHAKLRVDQIDREGSEAFMEREAEYTARIPEIYLTNKKRYEIPEQVKVAHILFDIKNHSEEEGLKLAKEIRAKIAAGEDFGKVAEKYSEDAGSAGALGELGWFSYGDMVPEFSKAAFALKKKGDVSDPVLTQFGWHLILFEGRKEAGLLPPEEAKKGIMEEQRQKFVEDYRKKALEEIENHRSTTLNEEAIDALYTLPPSPEVLKEMLKKVLSGEEKSDK